MVEPQLPAESTEPATIGEPGGGPTGVKAGTGESGADSGTCTEADVMAVLGAVIDPELGSDIVTLGMVPGVKIDAGHVEVGIALTTMGCPLRAHIKSDVVSRVKQLPGVDKVSIAWSELSSTEKAEVMATARRNVAENPPDNQIPTSTQVIMIASGKGGVGKSSVTANLAAALASTGLTVGVLDADIWGYSIPRMLGVRGRLEGRRVGDGAKIVPNQRKVGDGRLKVISMGFLVDGEETALMWRGLILNRAVQHFLQDVVWGDMDYLLIDMPPGTGDVQMGLAKMLPRAEMIIVTTPALAAQKVASRVGQMGRKNYLKVAGVIENMTAFVAPDGSSHAIFGSGGGERLASELDVPLLGKIPIDNSVADGGDHGKPAVLGDGPAAAEMRNIAHQILTEVVPPLDIGTCTVHLLEAPVSIGRT